MKLFVLFIAVRAPHQKEGDKGMRRWALLVGLVFLIAAAGCTQQAAEVSGEGKDYAAGSGGSVAVAGEFKPFVVYKDKGSIENHFIPSGWMGDFPDVNFNDAFRENPRSGKTCIRVVYSPGASNGARWVGIYWQNPANSWGNKKGGFDLTGARRLTFWAKGEKGGERIEEFKMGGITGEFPDSDIAGIGPVILTNEWKEYSIDLGGKDLSYISGGFCWSTNLDVNPDGCTFYLDDIVYE